MYKTDNILVCLDLTEMDEFLIRYAGFIADEMSPKKITFFHALHSLDLPGEIMEEFPDLDKPITELVKDDLEEKVKQLYKPESNIPYAVDVEDGNTSEVVLQYTKKNKIDLTVLGKKVGYHGGGRMPRRIMPLTPSSVLLVSESAQPRINHILVRNNFTRIDEIALNTAINMAERAGARVTCHHAFRLPLNHFPLQSSEKQSRITDKMKKHATQEYQRFMKKLNLDAEKIPCTHVYDRNGNEAQLLYHHALRNNADLVMIGSKIKSDLASVILDRTTEDMTEVEKNIPVLIVKDRKETLGFLEALFDW